MRNLIKILFGDLRTAGLAAGSVSLVMILLETRWYEYAGLVLPVCLLWVAVHLSKH